MLKIKTIDGQHIIAANHKELVIKLRQQDHAESPDFNHYMAMVAERHEDVIDFENSNLKNNPDTTTGIPPMNTIRIGSPVAFINSLHKLGYIIEIEQMLVHVLND